MTLHSLTTALILMLLLLARPMPAGAESIRLANGEWAPYLSESLKHYGAASHIITEAFAAAGVKVEYGFFPWKRSYSLVKDGQWHGSPVWVYTADRAKDFIYSDEVVKDAEYLFHLKSFDLRWAEIEDLRGLTIGATLHTVYPLIEKAADQGILSIERSGNYANLYRRLVKGRIDAVPNVKQVGLFLMRTTLTHEERSRITYSATVVQERHYHLILSRKIRANRRYVEQFNRGLRIIHQNGLYARILKQLGEGYYDREE